MTIAGILTNNIGVIIVGAVLLLFHGIYIWFVWSKVEFTAMLLQVTTSVMHSYIGVFVVTMGAVAVGAVWTVGSLMFAAVIKEDMEKKQKAGEAQPVLPMFISLIFSFYWTSEVISN